MPTVNVGTVLEYSPIPCRATGSVVAQVLAAWFAGDASLTGNEVELTRNIKVMTDSLKGAPLEYTKSVFALPDVQTAGVNFSLFREAHANPAALAARLMVYALKTGAKAGYANAPGNLMNFFQNRTSSRFNSTEILAAIAYLESRREGGDFECSGCKTIPPNVFDKIDGNLARWFNGLSLAKNGEITNETAPQKACMLNNQAHGAALELVGTAAYHALYEFGSDAGFSEADRFKILFADYYVKVPLRKKDGQDYNVVAAGDYGRQPDLVMEGDGVGGRYWIEFKSWAKGKYHITNNELNAKTPYFTTWKLDVNVKGQFPHGQKQYFLDYVATQGELESVWDELTPTRGKPFDKDENKINRAGSHRTWVQVWEQYENARKYKPVLRNASTGKWEVSNKVLYINRSKPWISTNGVITDAMTKSTDSRFNLLQEYLASAPDIKAEGFKTSVGYDMKDHIEDYVKVQKGNAQGTIAPFTLKHMLVTEAGEASADKILKSINDQIANSDFAEFLGGGDLTEAQMEALRKNIEEKILENLGPIGDAVNKVDEYTPDWWLKLEGAVQDAAAGLIGDDVRDALANMKVPELLEEHLCESYTE